MEKDRPLLPCGAEATHLVSHCEARISEEHITTSFSWAPTTGLQIEWARWSKATYVRSRRRQFGANSRRSRRRIRRRSSSRRRTQQTRYPFCRGLPYQCQVSTANDEGRSVTTTSPPWACRWRWRKNTVPLPFAGRHESSMSFRGRRIASIDGHVTIAADNDEEREAVLPHPSASSSRLRDGRGRAVRKERLSRAQTVMVPSSPERQAGWRPHAPPASPDAWVPLMMMIIIA